MRIAFFLRNARINRFRRAILGALQQSTVDEALICSGFFQDDHKYSAASDLALHKARGCSPLAITTIGLYSYAWRAQYSAFFRNLRDANPCRCFSATQMRLQRMGWHAKVFIAKAAGQPALAIVGSSNVTRRAFGEFSSFNYECDVVMWDEALRGIDTVLNEAIANADGQTLDVIVTKYDAEHPANRVPLQARLLSLESEIRSLAIPAR